MPFVKNMFCQNLLSCRLSKLLSIVNDVACGISCTSGLSSIIGCVATKKILRMINVETTKVLISEQTKTFQVQIRSPRKGKILLKMLRFNLS